MVEERDFNSLKNFLNRIPGIEGPIGSGRFDNGNWWVKFTIDITHPLAWNIVQKFGFILNYISIEERLPTVFIPVSPPPYLNGGPQKFLSWVIESTDPGFKPGACKKWLESRLPQPVEDTERWHEEGPYCSSASASQFAARFTRKFAIQERDVGRFTVCGSRPFSPFKRWLFRRHLTPALVDQDIL